jgi:hypothetical protein
MKKLSHDMVKSNTSVLSTSERWYDTNVKFAKYAPYDNDDVVRVPAMHADGSYTDTPLEYTAIWFTHMKTVRSGHHGGERLVTGVPKMHYVVLHDALRSICCPNVSNETMCGVDEHDQIAIGKKVKKVESFVKYGDGLFPMGMPQNNEAFIVWNELASMWVTRQHTWMDHQSIHLSSMIFDVLKVMLRMMADSMVHRSFNDDEFELFRHTVQIVQVSREMLWHYMPHSYEDDSRAAGIVQKAQEILPRDNMQPFIALLLLKHKDSIQFSLEVERQKLNYQMMEVAIKRMVKYDELDWVMQYPIDLFACFVTIPLVRLALRMHQSSLKVEFMQYEKDAQSFMGMMDEVKYEMEQRSGNKNIPNRHNEEFNINTLQIVLQYDMLFPNMSSQKRVYEIMMDLKADPVHAYVTKHSWANMALQKEVTPKIVEQKDRNEIKLKALCLKSIESIAAFYEFCIAPHNYFESAPLHTFGLLTSEKDASLMMNL